jgi:hypothetical protein
MREYLVVWEYGGDESMLTNVLIENDLSDLPQSQAKWLTAAYLAEFLPDAEGEQALVDECREEAESCELSNWQGARLHAVITGDNLKIVV